MTIEKDQIQSNRKVPRSEMTNDYFQWLCEIINVDALPNTYYFLIKTLHDTDFYWSVPNDDNRGSDGLKLREEYLDETYPHLVDGRTVTFEHPCSLLEMMVALADRIANIMEKPGENLETARWFWELIENLGLKKFTDDDWFHYRGTSQVDRILGKFMDRAYKRDGRGGMFPLRSGKKDQRNVEIWYQMCAYLIDNYCVDGEFM